MKKIVTISREFGSGGREIGKRLADILGIGYLDNEIVEAIAKETSLDETFLQNRLENGITNLTYAHSFSQISHISNSAMLIARQHKIIKEFASKTDCVIIGRGADAALANLNPFKIFVYADMPSKIARCRLRAQSDEGLSDKEIERKIKSIDKTRKNTHNLYSAYAWGDKVGYNLCINTTGLDLKKIVKPVAGLIELYFKDNNL